MLRSVRFLVLFLATLTITACDSSEPVVEDDVVGGPVSSCGYIIYDGSLDSMTLTYGGSRSIRLDDAFSQTEGEALTYSATVMGGGDGLTVQVDNEADPKVLTVRSQFEFGTFTIEVSADDTCTDSSTRVQELSLDVVAPAQ